MQGKTKNLANNGFTNYKSFFMLDQGARKRMKTWNESIDEFITCSLTALSAKLRLEEK